MDLCKIVSLVTGENKRRKCGQVSPVCLITCLIILTKQSLQRAVWLQGKTIMTALLSRQVTQPAWPLPASSGASWVIELRSLSCSNTTIMIISSLGSE